MDEQGVKIYQNQESSQKNRRKLLETTKGMPFIFEQLDKLNIFRMVEKETKIMEKSLKTIYLLYLVGFEGEEEILNLFICLLFITSFEVQAFLALYVNIFVFCFNK